MHAKYFVTPHVRAVRGQHVVSSLSYLLRLARSLLAQSRFVTFHVTRFDKLLGPKAHTGGIEEKPHIVYTASKPALVIALFSSRTVRIYIAIFHAAPRNFPFCIRRQPSHS